ncbi:MAG: branched-chain amino acid aminotransferase [Gammaproteobacteria bacterium]|nr:branched-chain amino acid aminotransferase [Gammaproteobacteria bacterium]
MSISINSLPREKRGSCPAEFGFGSVFSDHMFTQKFHIEKGWYDAEISPYHNIVLDPSAAVLHYSQEIFEGLKAYHRADGTISLFRPMENVKRFNRSANRMVMPEVDVEFHLDVLKKLIMLDQKWVPDAEDSSLYIRPAMIATSSKIGLGAAADYLHFIITGPAGAYFQGGFHPIPVYVAEEQRRAVVGGVGEAKTGGNYSASLYISEKVAKQGFTQVLWLDAIEGKYVEEVGAMNICFVYDGKHIVTPELSGSILPGITRDSVIKLAPSLGYEVSEKRLDINEVLSDIACGKITEVFGCGTAAVISPVGQLSYKGKDYIINENESGEVSKRLYDQLTGIQYGKIEDTFGWNYSLSDE